MNKPIMLQSEWCELPSDIRSLLKQKFNFKNDESAKIIDSWVISDGVSQAVLIDVFTIARMREYTGLDSKKFSDLLKATIEQAQKEDEVERLKRQAGDLSVKIESKRLVEDEAKLGEIESRIAELEKKTKVKKIVKKVAEKVKKVKKNAIRKQKAKKLDVGK